MDYIKGFVGSLLIYAVLPDVGLNKAQTVLLLIVGFVICTATIWKAQELRERYDKRKTSGTA